MDAKQHKTFCLPYNFLIYIDRDPWNRIWWYGDGLMSSGEGQTAENDPYRGFQAKILQVKVPCCTFHLFIPP